MFETCPLLQEEHGRALTPHWDIQQTQSSSPSGKELRRTESSRAHSVHQL